MGRSLSIFRFALKPHIKNETWQSIVSNANNRMRIFIFILTIGVQTNCYAASYCVLNYAKLRKYSIAYNLPSWWLSIRLNIERKTKQKIGVYMHKIVKFGKVEPLMDNRIWKTAKFAGSVSHIKNSVYWNN